MIAVLFVLALAMIPALAYLVGRMRARMPDVPQPATMDSPVTIAMRIIDRERVT